MVSKSAFFKKVNNIRDAMKEMLSALDYMHRQGIMHRDISSANIMMNDESEIKIIDFDQATYLSPNHPLSHRVGTVGYKAPELLLEQSAYDYRADIFSAGCVLADLLFCSHNTR